MDICSIKDPKNLAIAIEKLISDEDLREKWERKLSWSYQNFHQKL